MHFQSNLIMPCGAYTSCTRVRRQTGCSNIPVSLSDYVHEENVRAMNFHHLFKISFQNVRCLPGKKCRPISNSRRQTTKIKYHPTNRHHLRHKSHNKASYYKLQVPKIKDQIPHTAIISDMGLPKARFSRDRHTCCSGALVKKTVAYSGISSCN